MSRKATPASHYFSENVFDLENMRQSLPADVFKRVCEVMEKGLKMDLPTANNVATAMKNWAVERGCTHYTHWFQPMSGFTAEKHDSFIDHVEPGRVIESFSGKQLIQGEPDASSFPSGGIRCTFEARGYTIWDPTSPAFIVEYPEGNTLSIPSIFVSYTGESLDRKAPLLRSLEAISRATLGILKLFNNPAERVMVTLGIEQEFFLVDREAWFSRPDLQQTGRTLFGRPPSRHQQMEDQYFGNIPERAFAFMTEVEEQCYKLGIPLKTRHNEVAPNQFEFAPIFGEANVAIDQNQMLMDLMERLAQRSGLVALFHEKPFACVNGSGKHCNWSLATNRGENLLNPGKTPQENLQFLLILTSIIQAVHRYSRELRVAIASAGNDMRLGANEAPPAILSVFLGELLSGIVRDIAEGRPPRESEPAFLSFGIEKIPEIPRDNTDRNRTSPFAFTINKFEFRAVGSSATPSTATLVLNTAVASVMDQARASVEEKLRDGQPIHEAVLATVRRMLNESQAILFEGDNYSQDWEEEAKRRGLPNARTTPEALGAIISESSRHLFNTYSVFSPRELEARYHINIDNYTKQIEIEIGVGVDLIRTAYVPAAVRYLNELFPTIREMQHYFGHDSLGRLAAGLSMVEQTASRVSVLLREIEQSLGSLESRLEEVAALPDSIEKALAMAALRQVLTDLRPAVDRLEGELPINLRPLPDYARLLLRL